MIDIEIDTMKMVDLDDVMDIEVESFSLPWTRWMFEKELRDKKHSYFLVARSGIQVVGYIGFWLVEDEAHIVTIAVRSDFRRKHIGSLLMASALNLAARLGANRATLEVRVSNLPAQTLYKKFGFEIVAIRKNFYADTSEDAYVMWLHDVKDKIEEIMAGMRKILYKEQFD